MKTGMLPSVNVIYLRIYQKLSPISYHKQKNERSYWEGSGNISKLKKNSTEVTTSTTHHDSNNLLLKPENLYTV